MDDKNINYAFVDIGWKGSGLYALNKLQKRFGLRPSICFYWGTLKRCRGDFPIVYNTHVFDKLLPNYFINLIEDFFSANPQLSTIGYRKIQIIGLNRFLMNQVVCIIRILQC